MSARRPSAPFVGRSAELSTLAASLEAAVDQFATQTVLLLGEQGVGKTRLVDHWVGCLDSRQVRTLRASAQAGDGDFRVFRRLLQGRFPRPEDPKAQVEVIRAQVEDVMQDRRVTEILHFLGTFLGLAVRGSPFLRALEEAPGQQEQIACTVLCRFLELDAAQTPLLLVLDDLHLADERSLALFKLLSERLCGARIMLLGLGRPQLYARDAAFRRLGEDVATVELSNLPEVDAEALLRGLLAQAPVLPGELLTRALELSRGNPLYLEMLVSVLREDGIIRDDGGTWIVDGPRAARAELPMSVEEAARARVAVLTPDERNLLETAAVVGAIFPRSALVCVSRSEAEVDDRARVWTTDTHGQAVRERLEELVSRDYLQRLPSGAAVAGPAVAPPAGVADEVYYGFCRELERECLAAAVDVERRQRCHLIIAQWLETRLRERNELQLEELGAHYEAGGAGQKAAYCFVNAGDKARARFANAQAMRYYERGLALLEGADDLAKIEVLHNLGDVYGLVGRYTSAQEAFAEMLRLAWLLDHRGKGGAAHRRLGRLHRTMGAMESAQTHLRMAIRLFRLVDDARGVAATLDDLGSLLVARGEYGAALEHHDRALGLKREIGDPRAIAVSLHNLGIACDESGAFKAAQEHFAGALEIRRSIGDRLGVADTLDRLAAGHRARSDYSLAREVWLEALTEAHEIGDRAQEARILLRLGESLIQLGRLEDARGRVDGAAAIATELGDQLLHIETHRTLAELALATGDLGRARAEAELAYGLVEEVQLEPQRGLALRALGEIAAAQALDVSEGADGAGARALELFGRAADLFCALGNELELAKTYALLGNAHDRLGNVREAHSFRQRADEVFARLAGEDSLVEVAALDMPLAEDAAPPSADEGPAAMGELAALALEGDEALPAAVASAELALSVDDALVPPEQRETVRVSPEDVEWVQAAAEAAERSADITISDPEDRDTLVLRGPIDPADRARRQPGGDDEKSEC